MFLDTANINDINECMKTGVLKGITTNPTILLKENVNRFKQIENILGTNTELLFVQLIGDTIEELYDDYEKLNNIKGCKKIAYKVPINLIGLEVVNKIKSNNPKTIVLGTAIYSADQGILAALAGCDYVAPYVNRMSNNNINPFDAISKMRLFYDDRELECKILAASFKNTNQILDALEAGAHTCTIPTDLFKQMVNKELALNAIKVFNHDGQKLDEMTK
ncbi:transaldolase family protein [Clostridium estertheticum]|uniref:Transaldolase n=2 Tax=Clostridium estertheticum TaxID=238834 RepID=A0A1J0GCX5_9CLOT|nr:transaldolase family protein [Clostridium estertheticum]APC38840.1 transaldolase [Clostridium estertheticum subsp. estertheticum]MBU3074544.1 transaldolase [Clostridium estertheticum]MBU3164744.1 transaldolase [Clostridium estertheticum]MBU3171276.1 transaldolase [Clostridium estertheticum]MBU3185735.1 transaldolase [Clostridium estertheticum]